MATAAIFYRQTILIPRAQWKMRRSITATMKLLDSGVQVLRPVLVTAAILVAATHWAVPHDVGSLDQPHFGAETAVGGPDGNAPAH